jgi:DNA invertase Pin-like site-specific DNA recombinase
MRVAVYTRVSTTPQARLGFSLRAQSERLKAYCDSQGWTIAAKYVDDGHTGRDTNRPAYERMMDQLNRWDILLVVKMDRIHRNARNFMRMMDDLRRWGKDFVSATESLDTSTAMGRFVMDTIQRIAQLESEQISERVYVGMRQKALQGGFCGMSPPYGFDISNGGLIINPEEAIIVRRIHRRYGRGETQESIAAGLNEDGIPTKLGRRWTRKQVYRVLHSPIPHGHLVWDGVLIKDHHEAIIKRTGRRRKGRNPKIWFRGA